MATTAERHGLLLAVLALVVLNTVPADWWAPLLVLVGGPALWWWNR